MAKRTSRQVLQRSKRPRDVNQLAHQLVKLSTQADDEKPTASEISRVMKELGKRGGRIGGKRRAQGMTDEERSNAAALAARARWAKER